MLTGIKLRVRLIHWQERQAGAGFAVSNRAWE
jgi:hypothetical protein